MGDFIGWSHYFKFHSVLAPLFVQ